MRFIGWFACAIVAFGCSSSSSSSSSSSTSGAPGDASTGDSATAPTFTQIYTTVIQPNCTPCHAQGIGVSTGKLDMSSQATAYTNLVGVPAAGASCAGKGTRVTANDPANSVMYLKISLTDPVPCGEKMPLGLPALSKDNVALVQAWINGGAKND